MSGSPNYAVQNYIADWSRSLFGKSNVAPWQITSKASEIISAVIGELPSDYVINGDVAIHRTATVESGAVIKGPVILNARTFIAAGAYLRGGVYLDIGCTVGPACELKTTFMFPGSKVAHLSFVGDSIIGAHVNIEAGAVIANFRNEMNDKQIRILWDGRIIETGVDKFGALVGDGARIGANAVVAPGAIIAPGFRLARLGKIDQHPQPFE